MVSKMLADEGVRLPGTRRQQAAARRARRASTFPMRSHQELRALARARK